MSTITPSRHSISFTFRPARRRGAMLLLMILMLMVVLVMTVFAVDIAYMQLVKTELRTSTDAAARAASEALARTQSVDTARQAARDVAAANRVAGQPLQLDDADIIFGTAAASNQGVYTFVPGAAPVNSVRVLGRRSAGSPSGSVPLFLGGLLGTSTFEPELQSTSTSVVRDIALVLDRSGSMADQNKINDLKAAVNIFLDILQATPSDERVSLTSYSTTATKDQDMTSRLNLVRSAVAQMNANGFTAIGQGLQLGSDSLLFDANSRPFAEKTIVLLTDGIENRGPFTMPVLNGILPRKQVIHTITFGDGADQNLMRRVATLTGGTHVHAPTGQSLRDAFETIARTLAVLTIE